MAKLMEVFWEQIPELEKAVSSDARGILNVAAKIYTTNWVYGELNAFLRGEEERGNEVIDRSNEVSQNQFWEYLVLLQLFLMTGRRVPPMTVYRCMSVDKKGGWSEVQARRQVRLDEEALASRQTIVWNLFTSTAVEPQLQFLGGCGIIFELELSAEALQYPALGGVDVAKYSEFPEEVEILLGTDLPLKVVQVEPGPWPRTALLARVRLVVDILADSPTFRNNFSARRGTRLGESHGKGWLQGTDTPGWLVVKARRAWLVCRFPSECRCPRRFALAANSSGSPRLN
jgi:hypothetical protein